MAFFKDFDKNQSLFQLSQVVNQNSKIKLQIIFANSLFSLFWGTES